MFETVYKIVDLADDSFEWYWWNGEEFVPADPESPEFAAARQVEENLP